MGAWGAGIFDNDTACDFAASVVEAEGAARLEQALDRVLACGAGYLESPDAAEGLAAADIVARLKGSAATRNAYTAAIDAWVATSPPVAIDRLVEKARRVVARARVEPSELLELWQEACELEAWSRALDELSTRLA